VKARPFDTSSGPVWWAYATGATSVVPPTVGFDGVMALSNDRSVHSLERGIDGGTWPLSFVPPFLNGVTHSRSPIVPFPAADAILFAGDDSGDVNAINARTGQLAWSPPASFTNTMITGAPGGFYVRWGGPADVVLVGTRTSGGAGVFYSLEVNTGVVIGTPFTGGGNLGPITGTPALDYTTGYAYFTSWGTPDPTVWCVEITAITGVINPTPIWTQDLGDMATSPVLANGRIYVANTAGEVYSLDAADGSYVPAGVLSTGDGPVKGFLFPDRRGNDLYFATDTKVWSVKDDPPGELNANWTWQDGLTPLDPSLVLYWPQTDYLYVGAGDGRLYQLEFSGPAPSDPCTPPSCEVVVLGDGSDRIGAPSLDIGVVPPDVPFGKKLLHVGSEAGVLYAVEVPLP
jgi:outer membrane protein assembly factor BamB